MRKRERHLTDQNRHLTDENDALKTVLERKQRYLEESHKQLREHRETIRRTEYERMEKLWDAGLVEIDTISKHTTALEVCDDPGWSPTARSDTARYTLTISAISSPWAKRLFREIRNRG